MAKKDFENIYAKMIEQHNTETVPFLKLLRSSSIKICNRRVLKAQKLLELNLKSGKDHYYIDSTEYFIEYLVLNKFIIDLLDHNAYSTMLELILSRDESNTTIAAYSLYTLIEDKKKEIKSKMCD